MIPDVKGYPTVRGHRGGTHRWIAAIFSCSANSTNMPSMYDSVPSVLAIGSCRIFRPLRPLHESGLINLLNYSENQWFTHTAAAARQFVDVLDGTVHIAQELRRAALEADLVFPSDMRSPVPLRPDAVVVEVSSLKQHRVEGIELNAHKVYGMAVETGLDYRPIVQGVTTALPDEHVLKAMQVSYAKQDELTSDLLSIRDRMACPVMTVNHLYSEMPDGTPAPDRVRLTEALRQLEREHGIPMYDTQPAIAEYGIQAALEDQNHYRSSFESVVGDRLLKSIQNLLKGPTPPKN